MRADPEPDHLLLAFNGQGPPTKADADGIDGFGFMNPFYV
jgi:hypothetical protein